MHQIPHAPPASLQRRLPLTRSEERPEGCSIPRTKRVPDLRPSLLSALAGMLIHPLRRALRDQLMEGISRVSIAREQPRAAERAEEHRRLAPPYFREERLGYGLF